MRYDEAVARLDARQPEHMPGPSLDRIIKAAADKSGASFGVMLAPRETAAGTVAVKDLRSGEQVDVKRTEVADWLRTKTNREPAGVTT